MSDLKFNIYSIKYCSVQVPKELYEETEIPKEFKSVAVDPYARLKNGIEVNSSDLYEFVHNTPADFKSIYAGWQDFLKEVLEIKVDCYIFHN